MMSSLLQLNQPDLATTCNQIAAVKFQNLFLLSFARSAFTSGEIVVPSCAMFTSSHNLLCPPGELITPHNTQMFSVLFFSISINTSEMDSYSTYRAHRSIQMFCYHVV